MKRTAWRRRRPAGGEPGAERAPVLGARILGLRGLGPRVFGAAVLVVLAVPFLAVPAAQAQQDWFRPPANVGGDSAPSRQARPQRQIQRQAPPPPPQQEQRWRPLFPFFGLFDSPAPQRSRPLGPPQNLMPDGPPPQPKAPRQPEIAAEPRGTIYGSLEAARKASEKQLTASVMVVGDDYAGTLAQGLADLFAPDRTTIAVVMKTQAGSGLLPGGYDWPGSVGDLARQEQPTVIVAMIGNNDLKPLPDATGEAEPLDERWRELYGRRLDEFLLRLKATGRPVAVVGLAPLRDARASESNAELNRLIEERVSRAGLIYVDVWDGFVDENGKYVVSGPGVDGQKRRLRGADGVGFTRSGARKLGFFVDKAIGKLLTGEGAPVAGLPPGASPSGPPSLIHLTGATQGARELAGGGPPRTDAVAVGVNGKEAADTPNPEQLAARALREGAPLPVVTGRIDDFRWPPVVPASEAASAMDDPKSTNGRAAQQGQSADAGAGQASASGAAAGAP
ncbi:DUF459 domain-containing protein [Ancylobacter sp. 6x-1]|uniref:DUF459 domain-containing protein n=1 Tax=Ancylobacter crimeensis TaxID=2579147 RepID=A0ABT0DEK8_9HYPH|nr:GDSL-type esterase/lipase family protein [Ancylobacter crimeensis]MCK0198403.1 DUF459 domain-containing protein [Ancylobacter crimeensis]